MSVRLVADTVHLEGACHVEDAEPLAAHLEADTGRSVDISACGRLHAAVVQVLLVFRPVIVGEPDDPFTRDRLLPALREGLRSVAEGR